MAIREALLALLERGPASAYQLKRDFERTTSDTWPLNMGQVSTTLRRLERDGLIEQSGKDGWTDDDGGMGAASVSAYAEASAPAGTTSATDMSTTDAPATGTPMDGGATVSPTTHDVPTTGLPTTDGTAVSLAAQTRTQTAHASASSAPILWTLTEDGHAEVARWWSQPVLPEQRGRDELVMKLAFAVVTPGVDVTALVQRQRIAMQRLLHDVTRARRATPHEDLAARLVLDHRIFTTEAELRWLDALDGARHS